VIGCDTAFELALQGDIKYSGDAASVEAVLEELEKKARLPDT
jgi:hypothetical protein